MNKLKKIGLVGLMMGATALTGAHVIPEVSGNDDYIRRRIEVEEPRNVAYALRHNLAYTPKSESEILQQAYHDRETGKEVAKNLGYGFTGAGLFALLAGLYRRRKPTEE